MPPASVRSPTITVQVLLFAAFADFAGRDSLSLEVPSAATVETVLAHLRSAVAGLERLPPKPLAAVNRVHASLETTLREGDEIAFLPPLAGG